MLENIDHDNNHRRHLRTTPPRASHSGPGPDVWHILHAREHTRQVVPVSKTMKYSEGYLRAEQSISRDSSMILISTKKGKHQRKTLVPVSKTTKKPKGYSRADESIAVRFIRDCTRRQQQKHQSKALVRVDNGNDKNHQRHLRPAAPRVSHPGPESPGCPRHISRAREHTRQVVPVRP
jgi:hypothetical protein